MAAKAQIDVTKYPNGNLKVVTMKGKGLVEVFMIPVKTTQQIPSLASRSNIGPGLFVYDSKANANSNNNISRGSPRVLQSGAKPQPQGTHGKRRATFHVKGELVLNKSSLAADHLRQNSPIADLILSPSNNEGSSKQPVGNGVNNFLDLSIENINVSQEDDRIMVPVENKDGAIKSMAEIPLDSAKPPVHEPSSNISADDSSSEDSFDKLNMKNDQKDNIKDFVFRIANFAYKFNPNKKSIADFFNKQMTIKYKNKMLKTMLAVMLQIIVQEILIMSHYDNLKANFYIRLGIFVWIFTTALFIFVSTKVYRVAIIGLILTKTVIYLADIITLRATTGQRDEASELAFYVFIYQAMIDSLIFLSMGKITIIFRSLSCALFTHLERHIHGHHHSCCVGYTIQLRLNSIATLDVVLLLFLQFCRSFQSFRYGAQPLLQLHQN